VPQLAVRDARHSISRATIGNPCESASFLSFAVSKQARPQPAVAGQQQIRSERRKLKIKQIREFSHLTGARM
jgi:hypothetical protein